MAVNAQGEEAVGEEEAAQAQADALAALSDALWGLWDAGEGGGEGGVPGDVFSPPPVAPQGYTLVLDGDGLAAAATGLSSGFTRTVPKAKEGAQGEAGGKAEGRAQSPTSPLDPWAPAGAPSADGQNPDGNVLPRSAPPTLDVGAEEGGGDVGAAVPPPVGVGLPLFAPHGDLDVTAVEAHMVQLLRVPGAGRVMLPPEPTMDDVQRGLRRTALQVSQNICR